MKSLSGSYIRAMLAYFLNELVLQTRDDIFLHFGHVFSFVFNQLFAAGSDISLTWHCVLKSALNSHYLAITQLQTRPQLAILIFLYFSSAHRSLKVEHSETTKQSSAVLLQMSVQFHGFGENFVRISRFLELYFEVAIHNTGQRGLYQTLKS